MGDFLSNNYFTKKFRAMKIGRLGFNGVPGGIVGQGSLIATGIEVGSEAVAALYSVTP